MFFVEPFARVQSDEELRRVGVRAVRSHTQQPAVGESQTAVEFVFEGLTEDGLPSCVCEKRRKQKKTEEEDRKKEREEREGRRKKKNKRRKEEKVSKFKGKSEVAMHTHPLRIRRRVARYQKEALATQRHRPTPREQRRRGMHGCELKCSDVLS